MLVDTIVKALPPAQPPAQTQRETRWDLLVDLAATAAAFTPIWGLLLATTEPFGRVVTLKKYVGVAFPPAAATLVLAGTYGAFRNQDILQRLVTGFLAGLAANVVLDGGRLAAVNAGKMGDLCPMVGQLVLGENPHRQNPSTKLPAYLIGYPYHYVGNSALWGAIYALWFGKAQWWWGLIYGTWIGVMMLTTAPAEVLMGIRNFGFNKGPLLPPMIMLFHWLWGGTLGLEMWPETLRRPLGMIQSYRTSVRRPGMLGKRSNQRGLFEADHLYLDFVGRDSFYGFLASQRGRLFRDEDFAALYCRDNGRTSVRPSLLATALLLQTYERVSDEEAKARADFDLRWKVALGIDLAARPFAKSTLQVFRAQLIVHEQIRAVFEKSLAFARQTGYLKQRRIKVALDTSNILGRGAVKDTYNLLADGIVKLGRALATLTGQRAEDWAHVHHLAPYFGASSLKGTAGIEWDDKAARHAFLTRIVADADRVLALARVTLAGSALRSAEHQQVTAAADLLAQVLLQDVTRTPNGARITDGVAPDRVVSVHDPEMRHGRKSASKRFDGHKAAVAVDPESQLITAATVLAGNAPDNTDAVELVEQSEANARAEVEETIGDCAYGDGATRQAFADADRPLIAKVPARPESPYFAKEDFTIDPVAQTCTCPAGHTCTTLVVLKSFTDRQGQRQVLPGFRFDAAVCAACSVRAQCVRGGPTKGRTVSLHPQEALLQQARAFQRSDQFAPYRRLRQAAEHRIARLMQLGVRQARYFGRTKTLFQLLMAATVANLTLVATKLGLLRGRNGRSDHLFVHVSHAIIAFLTTLTASIACGLAVAAPSHS